MIQVTEEVDAKLKLLIEAIHYIALEHNNELPFKFTEVERRLRDYEAAVDLSDAREGRR